MITKYIKFLLIILALSMPNIQANPIASIFHKSMSGLHWLALIGPSLGIAGSQIAEADNMHTYQSANPEMEKFIKEELVKNNTPRSLVENLKIKIGDESSASYGMGRSHIITIPRNISDFNKLSDKQKKYLIATSRHEAAHIENKDLWKNVAVLLSAPWLAHYLVKYATYPITSRAQPYTPLVIQSFLKVPAVFLKLSIVTITCIAWSKYKEYSADRRAAECINDPEVLKTMSDLHHKFYDEYEKKHKLNSQERDTFKRFLYDERHTPDFFHPNNLTRARVFDRALEKLKKQNPS